MRRRAAFHPRVRQGFLALAEAQPQHYVVIDASGKPDEVFAQLLDQLKHRFS